MIKQHKDILARIIRGLRQQLLGSATNDGTRTRGNLDRELEQLGIRPDGRVLPIDALPSATREQQRAHYAAEVAIERMVQQGRSAVEARTEYLEQAAYSWINRLMALRALEARSLIDGTLRPEEEYGNLSEALYILRQENPAAAASPDGGWWTVIEEASARQAQALPGLFNDADPITTLRPSTPVFLDCLKLIGAGPMGAVPDDTDAVFLDPDAIGWAYQFYQEEAKQQAFASFGEGRKADTRATIAAATQLFTEPYMVKWLLQNSLGRTYHECYPSSTLPQSWEYYIAPTSDRPLNPPAPTTPNLRSLTILDPCVGSGHFLREAFDMLVAMYREQEPEWEATRIVENILRYHLHGIDIDPRAVQLTALTLYLRALDFVRTEAKQHKRPMPAWTPPEMHLATTPTALDEGALDRYLARHPEDRPLRPVLHGIFDNLQQAELLGSLLRPSHDIDTAIAAMQRPYQQSLLVDSDNTSAFGLDRHDPDALKRLILDHIAATFHEESTTPDPADALFGREAERGVRLLQLLDRRYAVVVTNPPYMGSKNMDASLKKFLEKHYKSGKRDLYSAFILRCLELSVSGGQIAMVTQQNWMFLRSFTELRAIPEEKLAEARKKSQFTGLLRETKIQAIAHLGSGAFSDISGEVVKTALLVFSTRVVLAADYLCLIQPSSADSIQKANELRRGGKTAVFLQTQFIKSATNSVLNYWVPQEIWEAISQHPKLSASGKARKGITTMDNQRFVRWNWEVLDEKRWRKLAKSLSFARWYTPDTHRLDWDDDGERVKTFVTEGYGGGNWSRAIANAELYMRSGCWCSIVSSGNPAFRILNASIFETKVIAVIPYRGGVDAIAAYLNTNIAIYLLRALSPGLETLPGAVETMPLPVNLEKLYFPWPAEYLLRSSDISICNLPYGMLVDNTISDKFGIQRIRLIEWSEYCAVLSLCFQSWNETEAYRVLGIPYKLKDEIYNTVGLPAGCYPLVSGYDSFLPLYESLDLPKIPTEVIEHAAQQKRMRTTANELARIKANLRALYEAGPRAKGVEQDEGDLRAEEDEEGEGIGSQIPIPTETFLEELSVKLQVHPISVYWLLEELRAEGVRCKPEERRLLEDRLSVLVLRLLGHRWPKQLEAGEPMPEWADRDGIVPVTVRGDAPLVERLQERLRAEDGDVGAQRTEALLVELTGTANLDDWLRRFFWPRHVKQFKFRPVVWHLASRPVKGKGKSARPLFECLVYYHATGGDALARLRTQYVEPLLRAEEATLAQARTVNNVEAAATITPRVQELQDLVNRLREVERGGFASSDLDKLLAIEPPDRWSGDGLTPPLTHDDLVRAERAWRVDLNDGVRVNIAPLQLAGLLAGDVLKAADAKKAIADRARWRADERRWVREGKLPRCGWMPDNVPESPEWTKRAPERRAEQEKLEVKRQATLTRLNGVE